MSRVGQGCTNCGILASWLRGNGERMGKWRGNEEMERDWLSTFPHSLFISYIKICHILMQNAKYGTFFANVTKIITYALWGNTSGSDLLRGSSASCAGLVGGMQVILDPVPSQDIGPCAALFIDDIHRRVALNFPNKKGSAAKIKSGQSQNISRSQCTRLQISGWFTIKQ